MHEKETRWIRVDDRWKVGDKTTPTNWDNLILRKQALAKAVVHKDKDLARALASLTGCLDEVEEMIGTNHRNTLWAWQESQE